MNICIVCSLNSKEECQNTKEFLEKFGFEVMTPFDDQSGTLLDIQRRYLTRIDQADLVLVIPKRMDVLMNIQTDVTTLRLLGNL